MYSLQETELAVEGGKEVGGKKDDEALVHLLRELANVQRNVANLQVELQGRQVCQPLSI